VVCKEKRRRTGREMRTDEIRKEVEKQTTSTKDGTSHHKDEREELRTQSKRSSRKSRMRRKREKGERCSCPNRLLIYTSVLE